MRALRGQLYRYSLRRGSWVISIYLWSHLTAVGHWGELHDGVEGHLHVGQLAQRLLQKVGQDAPQHRLVADQNNISLPEQKLIKIHRTLHTRQFTGPNQCFSRPEMFFFYLFGGLECVGHSFADVAHFVFLRVVWIRTQRAAVASRRDTNLATHLPVLEMLVWIRMRMTNQN